MFIFSNLATSLDGKIATRTREYFPLGSAADRKQMQVLRSKCDAILIGASTLRTFRRPCRAQGNPSQPVNVIVSSKLEGVSPTWAFFKPKDVRRILFVTGKLAPSRLKAFSKNSEVVKIQSPIASNVVKELRKRGVKRLLLEGGGEIIWEFSKQCLIDEYHVTLTPWVLGGKTAPTLVDGVGFSKEDALHLKLKKCRRVKNELFLTYVLSRRF